MHLEYYNLIKEENQPSPQPFSRKGKENALHPSPLHPSLKKRAFTLAEGTTHVDTTDNVRHSAFTLAEVLITLGIIGVVAAMTMPVLISNHKKQEYVTRLKKVYSILMQDIELSKVEYGDIQNWDWNLNLINFVDTYLLKNLQITNNCKTANGCWNTSGGIYNLRDNKFGVYFSSATYYKLQLSDGTYLAFQKQDNNHVHIFVDLNGNTRPDRYGIDGYLLTLSKDAFTDEYHKITRPGLYFYGYGLERNELINSTDGCSKSKAGQYCGALFQYDGWKVNVDYKF